MYIRCEKYKMFTNILHLRAWFFTAIITNYLLLISLYMNDSTIFIFLIYK